MTVFVFVVSGSLLLLLLLVSTVVVVLTVVVVVIVILPSFSAYAPSSSSQLSSVFQYYELLKVLSFAILSTLVKSDERYIIALEVRFWYLVSVYKHY